MDEDNSSNYEAENAESEENVIDVVEEQEYEDVVEDENENEKLILAFLVIFLP